jgi:hypothetical protein
VQLEFHQTPILKCIIMARSYSRRMQGACLGLGKKKSYLHRSLSHFLNQRGQYLCGMMHKVIYGTKVRMVRATRLSCLKVISKLSYLFPSLTPIS